MTAIRWPDDGNPATQGDPFWRPFMTTPPYPDYPCASTSVTGAITQTLRNFFGTNALGFSRTVTAPAVPLPAPMTALAPKTITRKYNSLSIVENEQARARVYEGFHFAEGCYVGIKAANQVANWVYAHELQPLPGARTGCGPANRSRGSECSRAIRETASGPERFRRFFREKTGKPGREPRCSASTMSPPRTA